jgi:hypothetical protein
MIGEQELHQDQNRKDKFYILLILMDLFFRAKCNSRKISGNFPDISGEVTIFREIQGVFHRPDEISATEI